MKNSLNGGPVKVRENGEDMPDSKYNIWYECKQCKYFTTVFIEMQQHSSNDHTYEDNVINRSFHKPDADIVKDLLCKLPVKSKQISSSPHVTKHKKHHTRNTIKSIGQHENVIGVWFKCEQCADFIPDVYSLKQHVQHTHKLLCWSDVLNDILIHLQKKWCVLENAVTVANAASKDAPNKSVCTDDVKLEQSGDLLCETQLQNNSKSINQNASYSDSCQVGRQYPRYSNRRNPITHNAASSQQDTTDSNGDVADNNSDKDDDYMSPDTAEPDDGSVNDENSTEVVNTCDFDVKQDFANGQCHTKMAYERTNKAGKERSAVCSECGSTFSNKYHLKRHTWRCHSGLNPTFLAPTDKPRGKYPCSSCPKIYSFHHTLIDHIRYKHTHPPVPTMHPCQVCDYVTKSVHRLREHIDSVHLNIKPYVCDLCGKRYTQGHNLQYHKERVHSEGGSEKNFACEVCGKKFFKKEQLVDHANRHKKSFRVVCELCGKWCSCISSLKNHKRIIHEKMARNYKCALCPYECYQKSILNKHEVIKHDKSTEYRCKQCDKFFYTSTSLNSHLHGVHKTYLTGEGSDKAIPTCSTCGKSFVMAAHLRRHMKTVHKIFNPPAPTAVTSVAIIAPAADESEANQQPQNSDISNNEPTLSLAYEEILAQPPRSLIFF